MVCSMFLMGVALSWIFSCGAKTVPRTAPKKLCLTDNIEFHGKRHLQGMQNFTEMSNFQLIYKFSMVKVGFNSKLLLKNQNHEENPWGPISFNRGPIGPHIAQ